MKQNPHSEEEKTKSQIAKLRVQGAVSVLTELGFSEILPSTTSIYSSTSTDGHPPHRNQGTVICMKICVHTGFSTLLPTQWPSRANLRDVSLIKLFIVHQKTNNLKSLCVMKGVMENLEEQSFSWPLFTSQMPALVFIDALALES